MALRTSEEIIEQYTPRMPAQQWEEIAAFVRDVVRRGFGPCCTRQWLNQISTVTSMVAWAREQGLPLDVEQIFHPATVNRYAVTVPGLADATRSCRRSALTALSRRITRVAPWEPSGVAAQPGVAAVHERAGGDVAVVGAAAGECGPSAGSGRGGGPRCRRRPGRRRDGVPRGGARVRGAGGRRAPVPGSGAAGRVRRGSVGAL